MKRWSGLIAVVIVWSVLLTGCGPKTVDDVLADLGKRVEKMDSYRGSGKMTLLTGEKPLVYDVEVWFKQPDYYRITLNNKEKNVSQMVLRNEDGVFVLTPHLNKTFRFQSNWPQNQGQVYLLQTLSQSILDDKQRKFTAEEERLVFDVTANYQNSTLARQTITLDKKTYAPQAVAVFDRQANKLVQMDFASFEFNHKFSESAFRSQTNTTGMTAAPLTEGPAKPQSFGVIEPNYLPKGVSKLDLSEFKLGEHDAVMLRYSGDYHFTLTESVPETNTVSAMNGEPVDLGYTVGVLLGDEQRTLTWTNEGVEFKLTTNDLPLDEMVKVAQSVQGELGK